MMMNNLYIESTQNTPKVNFDVEKKRFEIIGKSLPENTNEFYSIIDDFIEKYQYDELTMVCNLTYLNSSSSKRIYTILRKLKNKLKHIDITWIYDEDDEDMIIQGEEFEAYLGIKFNKQIRF